MLEIVCGCCGTAFADADHIPKGNTCCVEALWRRARGARPQALELA
jgi:hypothetical protein